MSDVLTCKLCFEIARELSSARQLSRVNRPDVENRFAVLREMLAHQKSIQPIVPPEILNLNLCYERVRKAHRLARAYRRKIRHEQRTGHKILLPPRV